MGNHILSCWFVIIETITEDDHRIWSFSGPYFPAFELNTYSVRMRENKYQKNSEYRHFSRSGYSQQAFLR